MVQLRSRERGSDVNDAAALALVRLLEQFGPGVAAQQDRLRSLLQDECPAAKREIAALMQAVDEGIPDDLLRVTSGEPFESLGPRLAKRLSEQKALEREAAEWAVQAWAHALGVDLAAPPRSIASEDRHTLPGEWRNHRADGGRRASEFLETRQGATPPGDADQANEPHDESEFARPARTIWADALDRFRGLSARMRALIGVASVAVIALVAWQALYKPGPEIQRVEMSEAFIADGKRRPIFVDFNARGARVRSIDIRVARSDGKWEPNNWTINIDPQDSVRGRTQAGTLSYRSQTQSRATFELVLVGADGKRSAPFERTFDITPPPATPPRITSINAPSPLYERVEFAVTIGFEDADGDVAKIERKVVESPVKWPDESRTVDVPEAKGRTNGAVTYRFGPQASQRSIVEFVLIDGRGNRSEPQRLTFEVLPPPAANASQRSAEPRALPQVPSQSVADRISNCIPPANLPPQDRWAWVQRNCLGNPK